MTESTVTGTSCLICRQEEVEPAATVFRDDLWALSVVDGFDVPGWFVLRVRRHAEGMINLNSGELDSFAQRARDAVAAVSEVTGAPATYFLVFGEHNPHFHALIAARGADVPEDRRTGDLLKLRLEKADRQAAYGLVPAVRRAYKRISAHAGHAGGRP